MDSTGIRTGSAHVSSYPISLAVPPAPINHSTLMRLQDWAVGPKL